MYLTFYIICNKPITINVLEFSGVSCGAVRVIVLPPYCFFIHIIGV
jgi:hypothetical protein